MGRGRIVHLHDVAAELGVDGEGYFKNWRPLKWSRDLPGE